MNGNSRSMTDKHVVTALLERAGPTYADEAGIRLADKPAPLYRLLVLSVLLSTRIKADIAVAATAELVRAGFGTPAHMREASWQDRVDALGRAHYKRYDESTATALGEGAELLRDEYRDDLRKLRERAEGDPARIRELLTAFPRLGPVGADIFCRDAQAVWPRAATCVRRQGPRRREAARSAREARRPGEARAPRTTGHPGFGAGPRGARHVAGRGGARGVTAHQEISRPDKTLFPDPGLTQGRPRALLRAGRRRACCPHLAGRPLVLHRFPDGVDESGFYQKQAPQDAPLDTVTVAAQNERGHVDHLLVDDVEGLRYLANQAVVELHRWLSRADDLDRPDLLVIDLDPPRRRDLAVLRRAARATRDLLGEIGLTPYLMTTGSRGYHVVAPLDRTEGFDEVRALARAVADRLAADAPDDLTTEQRIAQRGNRIYLDTNRNAYAQTAVAPYSPRARPGAPVATPIDFAELGRVEPDGYDTDVGRPPPGPQARPVGRHRGPRRIGRPRPRRTRVATPARRSSACCRSGSESNTSRAPASRSSAPENPPVRTA